MSARNQAIPLWLGSLVAALLCACALSGCDDPATTPEPSIDIDKKQQELRQKVEETQSEANKRINQVSEQIPDDAGTSEDAASAE